MVLKFKRILIFILNNIKFLRHKRSQRIEVHNLIKEKERISALPRYQDGCFMLNEQIIKFTDSASFLFMYNEIIEKQIYYFNTDADKPFIIDAGANIGLSIIFFKSLFPKAIILGFEPDPRSFKILKSNIDQFGFSDIEVLQKGVWDRPATLNFFTEGADGGRIALETDKENIIKINTIRLKDYLNKHVDFLKIDIEGAETNVLKDCADALNNVDKIFVEYHSFVNHAQNLHSLLNVLSEAGFRYNIQQIGVFSPTPFIEILSFLNMDNQLNIFAYRI